MGKRTRSICCGAYASGAPHSMKPLNRFTSRGSDVTLEFCHSANSAVDSNGDSMYVRQNCIALAKRPAAPAVMASTEGPGLNGFSGGTVGSGDDWFRIHRSTIVCSVMKPGNGSAVMASLRLRLNGLPAGGGGWVGGWRVRRGVSVPRAGWRPHLQPHVAPPP